jgi:site-specific DNA recombinase
MIQTVAIYARVSSERQARDNTIASQVAALRERVAQDGFVLSDALCFLDDGYSGSELLRPALERLRDAASQGLFDRLYVHAPDRLARRHAHQALLLHELDRCHIEVVFLNRPIGASAEDELLVQMQGVIAEYERTKIQERGRRGKRHAAQRGAVSVFSVAPYGYRYLPKTATTPARFEIVPDEAAVVQQIFAWIAQERCSLREACRRLQKQGILTRGGQQTWNPATLRGMLRNPAYCGQAAYGKTRMGQRRPRLRPQRGRPEVPRRFAVSYARPAEEWIHVPVPALVAAELFQQVAEQLRDNRQRHRARQPGAGHLLQGLVVCQACGYACYAQTARRACDQSRYGYYRCIGADGRRGDGKRVCHLPSAPLVPLEAAVWQDVCALLSDPSRIRAEYDRRLTESSAPSPQQERWQARRQRAQRSLARLIDAYAEGLLDKAEFEPRVRATRQRLNELDEEAKVMTERATREQRIKEVIHRLEQFAERVHHRLTSAEPDLKRELIRALVKRVELGAEDIRVIYRIDLHPFDPGPSGGHLRHCLWRLIAAFSSSSFSPSIQPLAASNATAPKTKRR